jgi:hypothetical protein
MIRSRTNGKRATRCGLDSGNPHHPATDHPRPSGSGHADLAVFSAVLPASAINETEMRPPSPKVRAIPASMRHDKSLQLTPKVESVTNGLSSLWFYKSDSAAQLNSMSCGQ